MAKNFKDWKTGECRIKADLVTPLGSHMNWYMPHLSKEEGLAFACLCNNIISSSPSDPSEIVEAILALNAKIQKDEREKKNKTIQKRENKR